MKYFALAVALLIVASFVTTTAQAQCCGAPAVTAYYAPAPTVAYYAPTTAYYPSTVAYHAPVTTTYYAPTTAFYAPTTAYYAPATAYVAPTTTFYAPTYVGRPGLFGWRWRRW